MTETTLAAREAEAMPGVCGVITSADVPGEDGFGVFVNDQPVMARAKVRSPDA